MTDTIFLITDDGLSEMSLEPYDSEDLLQELLAEHPSVLSGVHADPIAGQAWLLVAREAGVPDVDGGSDRWSLDHLFLDQDGIPTLIEVKRSSDTRIRREVVGQMLDYAANCVAYWPLEKVQQFFEATVADSGQGLDAEAVLEGFLRSDQSPEDFWQAVKTNLQAGRIRMVFVSDEIPKELQRIVEFLNEQMDPAEVLAIEVRQYVGDGLQTLVPRLIGRTAIAESRKRVGSSPRRRWDEASFFAKAKGQLSEEALKALRALYDFSVAEADQVVWGTGKHTGSFNPRFRSVASGSLFTVTDDGKVWFNFEWIDDEIARRLLVHLRPYFEVIGIELDPEHVPNYLGVEPDRWISDSEKLIEAVRTAVGRV